MAVDHSYVSRRIEKITYDEQGSILQDVVAVDAQFFEHGGSNSPAWMSERARVIILGVRRACAIDRRRSADNRGGRRPGVCR